MLRALTLSLLPLALAMDDKFNENNNLKMDTANFNKETELKNLDKDDTEIKLTLLEPDGLAIIKHEFDIFHTMWTFLWWLGGSPMMWCAVDECMNLINPSANGEGKEFRYNAFMWNCEDGGTDCEPATFVWVLFSAWLFFTVAMIIVHSCNKKQQGEGFCKLWAMRMLWPCCCCFKEMQNFVASEDHRAKALNQLIAGSKSIKQAQVHEWTNFCRVFGCMWYAALFFPLYAFTVWCNHKEAGTVEQLDGQAFFATYYGDIGPSPFIIILTVAWTLTSCLMLYIWKDANSARKDPNIQGEPTRSFCCSEYYPREWCMRIFPCCCCLEKVGGVLGVAPEIFPDEKFCCFKRFVSNN